MKTDNLPAPVTQMLLALTLLTRLPLPHLPAAAFGQSARAAWAYPIAGVVVGLPAGLLGAGLYAAGLPAPVAAGAVLATQMVMTCALHEDGLADVADGFWGGQDAQHRLDIMKDSQIGSYGTLALIIVTGMRWAALTALIPFGVAPVIAAAALSRGLMPLVMSALPHARASGLSHSVGRPDGRVSLAALMSGLIVAGVLSGAPAVAAFILALGVTGAVSLIARSKIGGQTGDVLGTVQQLGELTILVTLAATLT